METQYPVQCYCFESRGIFHTICTFLAAIGERFLDAGLRHVCVESGVIADGSVAGVWGGRNYNRAIRFHELMFEALNRLARNWFQRWIEEHHEAMKPRVDKLMQGLKQLIDSPCEPEFKDVMRNPLFEEVYSSYFCHIQTTFIFKPPTAHIFRSDGYKI